MSTTTGKWRKLATSNDATTSFSATNIAPLAAASLPTDGMIDVYELGGTVPDNIKVMFFGAGSNDQTYDVRVIGWELSSDDVTYIPTVLAVLTCTLSATIGATGLLLVATDRLVDTIVLASGFNQGVIVDVTSPTGDVPGHILLDH